MPPPVVSVVVPSRGGVNRLPVLLDALSRQQIDDEWEVVVVLDGDIDDSAGLLARRAATLPIRVVTFEANRGRSAALNAGFEAAGGDVLIRCDDDLVPAPDYLARHTAGHGGQSVGIIGLYRNVYPETTYARVYGRDWDRRFRRDGYQVAPDETWRYWAGNVSVSRHTWNRVGPYDVSFRAYGWEDVDWGYRLHQSGVPVVLDRGLETEHRIAATTTASRAQRAYYSGAAKRKFDLKHGLAGQPPEPKTVWDRAVAATAPHLNEFRAQRLGAFTDRAAGVLPSSAARKAIALVVESAARAGSTNGMAGGVI